MTILAPALAQLLRQGVVIPAHPLALTPDGRIDTRYQRGLTRYYCAAGVGGVAVGVHTTQFEIHAPESGLLRPVLALAAAAVDEALAAAPRPFIKIAGLVGPTAQACAEADLALELGYHVGLLSLSALRHADDDALIAHVAAVAARMPVMGFYLQPAVGGRILGYDFWRRMVDIENVVAIKIAPFNRYHTLDVVRAVAAAGRHHDIALYTGNDDNIIADLVTEYFLDGEEQVPVQIVGGLLGQWAVWTHQAVEMLRQIQAERAAGAINYAHWLRLNAQLTAANSAIFDVAHEFHGCIPGIHWVLQQQGLMQAIHTLNPAETLGAGQAAAIAHVCAAYPHLTDDAFVAAHRAEWLD